MNHGIIFLICLGVWFLVGFILWLIATKLAENHVTVRDILGSMLFSWFGIFVLFFLFPTLSDLKFVKNILDKKVF